MQFKVNDIVKISMPINGRYNTGTIISINGYDVYVKLNYRNIIVHRYVNELTKGNKMSSDKNIDIINAEEELYKILQEEIWKEIEQDTGISKQEADEQLIQKISSSIKSSK